MSPNRFFPFEGHGVRFSRNLSLPFAVPLIPWLPNHLTRPFVEARNYWPWELRRLVEEHGFRVVEVSTVLPVFEVYRVLPNNVAGFYRRHLSRLEQAPVIRHFGVSTLVVGEKT